MRTFHNDNAYLSDSIYDKQRTLGSPYMSKERMAPDIYGSRDNHYSLKKQPPIYPGDSMHSVHSLLRNDYQQQQQRHLQQHQQQHPDHHSDRMSEGSDKNGYHFPYTAEEDHLASARKHSLQHNQQSPALHSSQQILSSGMVITINIIHMDIMRAWSMISIIPVLCIAIL
ncbi:hypothetical protein DOY81_012474 [Sarcophaga bullata]|nr:hypothetical protein DOY81_012474 [Sarcophaga bullata]